MPIDPGKHTIDASAKGKKPFATTVDVSDRLRSPTVEIPPLDSDSDVKGGPAAPPPADHPDPSAESGGTQRTIGVVGMGLGGAGLVIGSIFGLRTSSKWSETKDHCSPGLECDRTGVELAAQAKNAGTVSTISFIAGGVLLAGGAALFFTAPSAPKKSEVKVGLGFGNLTVQGRF